MNGVRGDKTGKMRGIEKDLNRFNADKMGIDEVVEIVNLPNFTAQTNPASEATETVELSPEVVSQLRDYVSHIAAMYRDNAFHSFEVKRRDHTESKHPYIPV